MPVAPLYKYRSLDNWKPVLDILVNSRLYAAPFQSLNDPMEGRYYYFGDAVKASFRKAILQSKMRRNICSLSRAKHSTLLWSYYAAGHTGIALGVQIRQAAGDNLEIRNVTYDSGVHIGPAEANKRPDVLALNILTQKQQPWEHEKEVRVFAPSNYVNVKLTEILLGCNISAQDSKLVSAIARKWHPRIRITKIDRSTLDRPEAAEQRPREA